MPNLPKAEILSLLNIAQRSSRLLRYDDNHLAVIVSTCHLAWLMVPGIFDQKNVCPGLQKLTGPRQVIGGWGLRLLIGTLCRLSRGGGGRYR